MIATCERLRTGVVLGNPAPREKCGAPAERMIGGRWYCEECADVLLDWADRARREGGAS